MAMDVATVQRRSQWRLLKAANSTNDTVVPAKTATITKPVTVTANNTVITPTRKQLEFIFFGRHLDDLTINFSLIKWSSVIGSTPTLYVQSHLIEVSASLSSSITGVAGHVPSEVDMFADTITSTNGDGSVTIINGDPDKTTANLIVDARGCEYLEIYGDRGTATQWNGLYREIG